MITLSEEKAEGLGAAEFTRLVESHAGLVFAAIYAVIPQTEEADDLAQETFLRAWEKRDSLRDPAAASTWLYRIARNTAVSYLRKQRKQPETVVLELQEFDPVEAAPSPQQAAMDAELGAVLRDSLELMPDTYRVPLVLSCMEDISTAQIAEMMGVSEEVVRQRLSRGRKALRAETAARLEEAKRKRRSAKGMAAAVMAAIASGQGVASASALSSISLTSAAAYAGGGATLLILLLYLTMCAGKPEVVALPQQGVEQVVVRLTLREPNGAPGANTKVWFTTSRENLALLTDEEGMAVATVAMERIVAVTACSDAGINRVFVTDAELRSGSEIVMRLEEPGQWQEPPLPDGFSWPDL